MIASSEGMPRREERACGQSMWTELVGTWGSARSFCLRRCVTRPMTGRASPARDRRVFVPANSHMRSFVTLTSEMHVSKSFLDLFGCLPRRRVLVVATRRWAEAPVVCLREWILREPLSGDLQLSLLRKFDATVISANVLRPPRPIGQISIGNESGIVALNGHASFTAKCIPEHWLSHLNKYFHLSEAVPGKVRQNLGKSMGWHGMAWHGMVWYGMVWHQQMRIVIAEPDVFCRIMIS
jgi:hypothetical protein